MDTVSVHSVIQRELIQPGADAQSALEKRCVSCLSRCAFQRCTRSAEDSPRKGSPAPGRRRLNGREQDRPYPDRKGAGTCLAGLGSFRRPAAELDSSGSAFRTNRPDGLRADAAFGAQFGSHSAPKYGRARPPGRRRSIRFAVRRREPPPRTATEIPAKPQQIAGIRKPEKTAEDCTQLRSVAANTLLLSAPTSSSSGRSVQPAPVASLATCHLQRGSLLGRMANALSENCITAEGEWMQRRGVATTAGWVVHPDRMDRSIAQWLSFGLLRRELQAALSHRRIRRIFSVFTEAIEVVRRLVHEAGIVYAKKKTDLKFIQPSSCVRPVSSMNTSQSSLPAAEQLRPNRVYLCFEIWCSLVPVGSRLLRGSHSSA